MVLVWSLIGQGPFHFQLQNNGIYPVRTHISEMIDMDYNQKMKKPQSSNMNKNCIFKNKKTAISCLEMAVLSTSFNLCNLLSRQKFNSGS